MSRGNEMISLIYWRDLAWPIRAVAPLTQFGPGGGLYDGRTCEVKWSSTDLKIPTRVTECHRGKVFNRGWRSKWKLAPESYYILELFLFKFYLNC